MKFSFLRPTRIFKGTVKTVANVPAWLGFSFLKETSSGIFGFLKPVYQPVEEKKRETFEQALQRLDLTEADLKSRLSNLRKQSWLFGTLSIGMWLYAVYLLIGGHLGVVLVAVAVGGLFGIKMLSCRFWVFQIKQRKLGCSMSEWLQGQTREQNS